MARINSLTPEQIAKFPAYVQEWTGYGVCTDPADRIRAEAAIAAMYEIAGKKPPRIVWCDSPLSMALTRAVVQKLPASVGAIVWDSVVDSVGASVRASVVASVRDSVVASVVASVRDSVGASVWDSVWDSVVASVRDSVGASVRDSVGASVRASVRDSVWASVGASVWDSVGDSVGASVRDSVGDSVRASVRDSVWASVGASVWDSVGDSVVASVYGQHDASWLAFYRFFRDECGMTGETEKLRGLWDLCQSCGWILPFENVCFASERHDVCKLDGRGVIHCEDGPAIHYRDGFSVHAWHGTRVPAHWIEDRANLKASEVMAERNVEVRRAGIEILGWKEIIDQLGGKVIEADADPEIGTVIELSLPDLPRPARFLRVRCATGRDFALGLPPDLPTADGYSLPHCAQAWAAQLHPAEWRKPLQTA